MTDKRTPEGRLSAIVEQGLCIGCGLCQSVAGADKIRVVKCTTGELRPVPQAPLGDEIVDRIYDTCPGTHIEGLPERLCDARTRQDPVWGPYRRIVRAWASDREFRHEGATGGVLTALADFLIASKRVEFVLHVRASQSDPGFGVPHLSFTRADVLAASGSRYGPTAVLTGITDVLDRGEPFAFIGKPCDIAALRNFSRHDSRVDRLVKYWLTPVCGGYMPTQSLLDFLQVEQIVPDSVTSVRYRGRGCPGPTRIETTDAVHEYSYLDFWGEDDSAWSLPSRCKICPDGIGEAADIAASDTWPGGAPSRDELETDPGVNGVVTRTAAGEDLLRAAVEAGALVVERAITPDDMNIYQPHQVTKKLTVWSRYQGMADEGRFVPQTARLRIGELAGRLSEEERRQQRDGMRERIRTGRASEPPAKPS